MKKFGIYFFSIALIGCPFFVLAQNAKPIPDCPYVFTKNMAFGSQDHDVYILQQVLNSDKRTMIAADGVGSPGNESSYFGQGTRSALKRFQALFIEFIGTADGVFNEKTRLVAQSICNGDVTGGVTQPQANVEEIYANEPVTAIYGPVDGPRVSLSANVMLLPVAIDVKVFVNADREINKPTVDAFIIDGGVIKEIRKLSKYQYYVLIGQIEGAKRINLQVEAEKITDLGGNANIEASNEIIIEISETGIDEGMGNVITDTLDSVSNTLSELLKRALGNSPATQMCNGVQISANVTCNASMQPSTYANQPVNSSSGSGFGGGSGSLGGAQQSPFMSLGQILGGALGGIKNTNGGRNTATNSGNVTNPTTGEVTAPTKSPVELAQEEVNAKCGAEGTTDPACRIATEKLAAAEKASKECSDAPISDADTRKNLALVPALPNAPAPQTSFQGMPQKFKDILAKIKAGCGCDLRITGGTESHGAGSEHKSGALVFDVISPDMAKLSAYMKSGTKQNVVKKSGPDKGKIRAGRYVGGKLPAGVFVLDETGSACTGGCSGSHFHVDGDDYKCGS